MNFQVFDILSTKVKWLYRIGMVSLLLGIVNAGRLGELGPYANVDAAYSLIGGLFIIGILALGVGYYLTKEESTP